MQPQDSSRCPGTPVQPAGFTAESVSALKFKKQQLQVELLRVAVHAAKPAQQAATDAAAATAAAEHRLQAPNLKSSTNSPRGNNANSPVTAAVVSGTRTALLPQCATGGATAKAAGTEPLVQGFRPQRPQQQQQPALDAADQQLPQLQALTLPSSTPNPLASSDADPAELAVTSLAADSTQQMLRRVATAQVAAAVIYDTSAAAYADQAAASAAAVDQDVQGCGSSGRWQPSAAAAVGIAQGVVAVSTPELTARELVAEWLLSALAQEAVPAQIKAAAEAAAAGRVEFWQHILQWLRSPQQPVYSQVADLPAAAAAAAGRDLGSTPPAEPMAAAAARTAAATTAAPGLLPPGSSTSSNPMQPRSLHPIIATAAAATAAVTTQAELWRLSNWDTRTLKFKERTQNLVDAVAKQQLALDLDPDQLTDQDLMLLLQPIEHEMAEYKHLGDPIDKSKVASREGARIPKVKARRGKRHVSADNSSREGVSANDERCEAGPDSRSQSNAVISYHEFAEHFHLAASKVAAAMGMGLTKFKTKIRELGIKRWPGRGYKAIEDAIEYLQSKADDAKDHAAKPGRILMLRHLRCLLDKYPNMNFDEHPARDLIDAIHKQKYKKRKQEEKGEHLTAVAGADTASAAAAASSDGAGTSGSQVLDGDGTQRQEKAESTNRKCRRQV